MSDAVRILVVANRTAATPALLDAVRERSAQGNAIFHLVVPATPHGLDRMMSPEDNGREEAAAVLRDALPALSTAAGNSVTGSVGDPDPINAIADEVNLNAYDELIISTLAHRVSKWMHLDLPSKAKGFGLPITHVSPKSLTTA
ncbi:MAG: hypothetical protein QOF76_1670 [Solirubrobacteraceae bacterium]|jgi:hypothetical protein|nr:hypothetical protein [Solirubrobacteraceae bacterium]